MTTVRCRSPVLPRKVRRSRNLVVSNFLKQKRMNLTQYGACSARPWPGMLNPNSFISRRPILLPKIATSASTRTLCQRCCCSSKSCSSRNPPRHLRLPVRSVYPITVLLAIVDWSQRARLLFICIPPGLLSLQGH